MVDVKEVICREQFMTWNLCAFTCHLYTSIISFIDKWKYISFKILSTSGCHSIELQFKTFNILAFASETLLSS